MPYEAFLSWAEKRPEWQQDTLRRLALHGELTEADLADIRLQIEHEEGLIADNVPDLSPLKVEHLSNAAGNEPKTVLVSLGPVQNVDRLAPGQPPLRFAVNGLTLIYGANASGKSGYCRIAKQLCRSQSPGELRGNIYNDELGAPPAVVVAFRVGDDEQPKEERLWVGDQEPPLELARISVFDTATARIYVDKERKIEFLPYELDLMNKLGLACRVLDNNFKEREAAANAAVNVPLPTGYNESTSVHAALARLVTTTALDQLPTEQELRTLGKWSEDMQTELNAATERLNRDPQVMARLRTEAKQALETVKEDISAIAENLGNPAIAIIREKHTDSFIKSRVAETEARDLFREQPISDLGSEAWRQMLLYAREFATTVFPNEFLPQLATSGICVLCQQNLGEDAAARLAAFDAYIAGRAAEESALATKAFNDHQDAILAFKVKARREIETILAGYAALREARKQNATAIASFVEKAGERLEMVKGILQDSRFDALDGLEPLPASPAQLIDEEIARLGEEIAELENTGRDEAALTALRSQHAELTDQKRLSEEIEIIVKRRSRLEERHRFRACRQHCRLTAITRRITERRREVLTPTLKSALSNELRRLRLTHIPLNLSDRGDGAESMVQVALTAQQRVANNSDILSEGEQRALALACFLAELPEVGNDHGIIVDDPVSSLDHTRMQAMAERLAEEAAKGRQVIVFTHNILFHHMLLSEARRARVGLHREWMSSAGNDCCGLIDAAQKPWQMKRVSERLQEIAKELNVLICSEYDHTDQRFRPSVISLYTKMRETWERVVEEILFNDAVKRFRPEIMTQRLEAACIDPGTDYPAIFEGMKRCSHYSGHDPAVDLPPNLPYMDQIRCDVQELKNFSDIAKERQRQLRSAPAYESGVEPVLL